MISAARSAYYLTEHFRIVEARKKIKWNNNKVSILLPTHNRADILMERAIPSVLAQNNQNWELLVAAHGCTDDTAQRVYDLDDRRIKLLILDRHPHYPDTPRNRWLAGPVEPLNRSLPYVTGGWIARIDDDDEWTPDHLSDMLSFALRNNLEFVSSPYIIDYGDYKKTVPHDNVPPVAGGTQTWIWRSYLSFMKWNPDCWRKSWNAVNDTDLVDRFRRAGVRMGWWHRPTCIIRPRPGETEIGLKAYLK